MDKKINQILQNLREYVTSHDYKNNQMLTAYIDIDPTNPANNRQNPAWSIELKNEFKKLEAEIDPERLKRRAGQKQWEQVEKMVREYLLGRKPTGRSIALFSDLEDYLAVELPVKMPTRLYFGFPQIKHLLFALDQYKTYEVVLFSEYEARLVEVFLSRTSADMIVDSKHAKEWRLSRKFMEDGDDRRSPEFQRRFVNDVASEINQHFLGNLEFERLIFGGNQKTAHAVKNSLNPVVRDIVVAIQPIDFKMHEREIADLVRGIADIFEKSYDLSVVEELMSLHGRGGAAVIMQQDVEKALALGQVKRLILSYPIEEEKFNPLIVDAVVQGVGIEFVVGEAAERLNQYSGIGALLYY